MSTTHERTEGADVTREPMDGKPGSGAPDAPDLASQLEDLFHQVWSSEANWALDDRIDLSLRIRRDRPKT
jgi:hypothetical protein